MPPKKSVERWGVHEGGEGQLLIAAAEAKLSEEANVEFLMAAKQGRINKIRQLSIEGRINIDFVSKDINQTALALACSNGHTEIVDFLLENGFKVIVFQFSHWVANVVPQAQINRGAMESSCRHYHILNILLTALSPEERSEVS